MCCDTVHICVRCPERHCALHACIHLRLASAQSAPAAADKMVLRVLPPYHRVAPWLAIPLHHALLYVACKGSTMCLQPGWSTTHMLYSPADPWQLHLLSCRSVSHMLLALKIWSCAPPQTCMLSCAPPMVGNFARWLLSVVAALWSVVAQAVAAGSPC